MTEMEWHPFILRDRKGEKGTADQVLHWWARLAGDDGILQEFGGSTFHAAVRAELRHATSPDDALLTEGFRNLWFALPNHRRTARDMRAWGLVAAILAEVRMHDTEKTFAERMGAEVEPGTGKPRVSELRFRQLLRSNDLDELLRRARRAVHLLGDQAHVPSLADDLLLWHREHTGNRFAARPDHRLAVRWANSYFTELGRHQKSQGVS